MFGLFKKQQPSPINASSGPLRDIAEAAQALVGVQLMLASRTEVDLLGSKFTLGYLAGVCDALLQKRGMNREHGLAAIAAIAVMFPGKPEVAALVAKLGNDNEFFKGQLVGHPARRVDFCLEATIFDRSCAPGGLPWPVRTRINYVR